MLTPDEQIIPRRRKLVALDGLRGLAVLVVMVSHLQRFLPHGRIVDDAKGLLSYGWVGVDLFFVLSGFLITGILVQSKSASNYFQSFYARRFLRIFPIYYLTLAAVFGLILLVPGIPNVPPPSERWLYFTYLLNWIPVWTHTWPPNVLGHFWTLAVEEQFYLVWPVCVLLLSPRNLVKVAISLSTLALVIRLVWVAHSPAGANEAVIMSTVTRMDSLLIGALAALSAGVLVKRFSARQMLCVTGTALGIFVVGCFVLRQDPFPFITTIGYTLLALAFAPLILVAATTDGRNDLLQRIFRNRVLLRTGKYSYGMYVYHVPLLGLAELLVFRHFTPAMRGNLPLCAAYIIGVAVLTFAIAAASFEFFERPILNLKRYVEPLCEPRISDQAKAAAGKKVVQAASLAD